MPFPLGHWLLQCWVVMTRSHVAAVTSVLVVVYKERKVHGLEQPLSVTQTTGGLWVSSWHCYSHSLGKHLSEGSSLGTGHKLGPREIGINKTQPFYSVWTGGARTSPRPSKIKRSPEHWGSGTTAKFSGEGWGAVSLRGTWLGVKGFSDDEYLAGCKHVGFETGK